MTENKKTVRKEFAMTVLVVILAFGLTVAGIVYLTNFIIGEEPKTEDTEQSEVSNIVQPKPNNNEEETVTFTLNDDKNIDETVEPQLSVPISQSVPATVQAEPDKVAVSPAPVTQTTAPEPKPAPAAKSAPAATERHAFTVNGNYEIQLFSLQSQAKAESEAKKYLNFSPDTYVLKSDLGSKGVWYRVRCCRVNTKSGADSIKSELETKYKITPMVVQVK